MKIPECSGVYGIATEELRRLFQADACLLVVLGGNDGTAFSISAPEQIKPHLPILFRTIAQAVEDALVTEKSAMVCPVCRALLAFPPRHPLNQNNIPRPGALTVCAHCASFITLDESGAWRILTEEELADMPDDARNRLIHSRRDIQRPLGRN